MSETQKQKTILVVDDDETLREAIVFDFKRKGYRVFSACDGLEAFETVQKETIDAVVTDIRMPKANGVELLDMIKSFNHRIPVVIFITGFADLTLEDAYDKGACAVMSKPFDRKALQETVRRALLPNNSKFSEASVTPAVDLNVELAFSNGQDAIQAKVLSIGQGGMFLSVPDVNRAKLGQPLTFRIESVGKGLTLLAGSGYVRWIRSDGSSGPIGVGVEFVFLNEECRDAVVKFLEQVPGKAFIPKAA